MAALRVTYVIPGLGTGGAEHSLAELLAHGFGGEIDAEVVCLHHRDEGVERRVVETTKVPVTWLAPGSMVARARELRSLLKADPPDLLVTSVYEADIIGRLARTGLRRPRLITTLVNSQYDRVRVEADPNVSRVGMFGTQVIDAITGRLAVDHYLALTEAVAQHAVQHLKVPRRRITVVPRGRSRARLGEPGPERTAAARTAFGIEPGRPVLVTVGRREYQKGQIHLIEAMPAIVARHPDVVLLVAGREGNAASELDAAVDALGLADNVRFLGHVNDIPGVLAVADLFVFPSLWEGFGGALIEALALGVPAVVSSLPELREVLGQGEPPAGVTVPPADPAALAEAVSSLLDEPDERAAIGAAGRARFDGAFEMDTVADLTLRTYRHVAAGS